VYSLVPFCERERERRKGEVRARLKKEQKNQPFQRRREGVRRAPPRDRALGRAGILTLGAGRIVAAITAARKKWVEEGMNLAAGPSESTKRARAVGGEGRGRERR
jgi:hypothetical protein